MEDQAHTCCSGRARVPSSTHPSLHCRRDPFSRAPPTPEMAATTSLPIRLRLFRRHHLLLLLDRRSLSSTVHPDDAVSPSPSSSSSSSRKEQHNKLSHRLASVVDAVNERKLPRELRGRPNAVRSETDIENVVEKRVWRAMEEGHFENLQGKGKPLKLDINPHVDPAEDTLYRILSRSGCSPEWVELNKEIRAMIKSWRLVMKRTWLKRSEGDVNWMEEIERLKKQLNAINSKVLHYNLIVPFGRQMCSFKWEKEVDGLEENQNE